MVADAPDALLRGRIRLYQPARGPRVSLDALLLADFARGHARGGRVCDLGCGTGVVAIAVLAGDARARGVGVELVPALVELARRNAALNDLGARLEIVEGDLARAHALPLAPASFDLVVANPPWHRGRPAPDAVRALARHEIAVTLADVLAAARRLLRPKGKAALVYPADQIADLSAALRASGLRPCAYRFVHSVAGEPARRVLALAVAGYKGGVQVMPPLVVHAKDRRAYTEEVAGILGDTDASPEPSRGG